MQETQVWSLGWEDPLEEGVATHSSILAWETPWTEEPGELQSMGLQRSCTQLSNWTITYKLARLVIWEMLEKISNEIPENGLGRKAPMQDTVLSCRLPFWLPTLNMFLLTFAELFLSTLQWRIIQSFLYQHGLIDIYSISYRLIIILLYILYFFILSCQHVNISVDFFPEVELLNQRLCTLQILIKDQAALFKCDSLACSLQ